MVSLDLLAMREPSQLAELSNSFFRSMKVRASIPQSESITEPLPMSPDCEVSVKLQWGSSDVLLLCATIEDARALDA